MTFIIPLSCLPNRTFLCQYSALGIFAILSSYFIIYIYGIQQNGLQGFSTLTKYDLYPQSIHECSTWFGVVVYSYGIVPLTHNIQESMRDPKQMACATTLALKMVFLLYVGISAVFIIYAPLSHGTKHYFNGDVLQHLPSDGIIPAFIRYAMLVLP